MVVVVGHTLDYVHYTCVPRLCGVILEKTFCLFISCVCSGSAHKTFSNLYVRMYLASKCY